MSELKATTIYDAYWKANSVGEGTGVQVYLKSEADKVIAHHKYKRCLAMAEWCKANNYSMNVKADSEPIKECCLWYCKRAIWWNEWRHRWLELAEQFKEVK